MEVDHDQSPDTRLQRCTGYLVPDMQQNQHRNHLANCNRLPTDSRQARSFTSPEIAIQAYHITQNRDGS